jgi:opacity protein-like surface antigen
MMKKKYIIVLLSIILLISKNLNAQKLLVGFDAGFTNIINENYYSKNPNDNNGFGLGLDNLYQISAKLKYGLNFLPVYLTGNLSYLGGRSDYTYLGILNIYDSHFTEINLKSSMNIFSIGFGLEYPIQFKDLIPYVTVGFLTNYFDDLDITQTPKPDDLFNLTPSKIESSVKLGAYFGGGLDYKINNKFLIGLSLKYSFMNLSGKKDILPFIKEDEMNILSISTNILYSLSN